MRNQHPLFTGHVARNLLALILLTGLVWYLARDFTQIGKGTDFPDFYAAARMVRDGMGKQLYQPEAQIAYQTQYVGRSGSLYLHPPFEVLLYLPFSFFSLKVAYLLWTVFTCGLLAGCAHLLRPMVNPSWSWQIVFACSVLFTPVLLCLMQGQDSILLLLILLLSLRAMDGGQDAWGGMLLACGLFKFHLVLPLFLILAVARKRKFIAGFGSAALLLILISVGISGWAVLAAYPSFLLHLSHLPMPGNSPTGMANLHGLVATLPLGHSTHGVWLGIGSLAALGLAIAKVRQTERTSGETGLSFALAVTAALLVSYHQSPHDLVLLLIPLAVVIKRLAAGDAAHSRWWPVAAFVVLLVLLPPLLYVDLLRHHAYFLLAVPNLGLFGLLASAQTASPPSSPSCKIP